MIGVKHAMMDIKHTTEHTIHVTNDAKHATWTSNMKQVGKFLFSGSYLKYATIEVKHTTCDVNVKYKIYV